MRIETIRIQNFRSFEDETIHLSDYSCFVGPNGSGKSSVLAALNILFRNASYQTNVLQLSQEDFHLKRTEEPIRITVTFCDLSEQASTGLEAYVRQDRLVVSAVGMWNEEKRYAEVQQVGSRMVIPAFRKWFEAEKSGKKVAELREIFMRIKNEFPDLQSETTKTAMEKVLRNFEEANPNLCELVESSDQFYGWTKGINRLEPHVQWIYVPAVKDASEEENESRKTALGQLLQRTIRGKIDFGSTLISLRHDAEKRYRDILSAQQNSLSEISESLQSRLQEWAHPGAKIVVEWNFDEEKSIVVNEPLAKITLGEGPFSGALARFGHGMQRSFLVSVLHELATVKTEGQPTLILGFEEPELYQHPPQARHLAGLLQELATKNNQVIVTTHSPYFVSGQDFESIRLTRKDSKSGVSSISSTTHADLSKRLAQALGEAPRTPSTIMAAVQQIMQPSLNELFFSRLPVLVEGLEDVAYISTHLHLTRRWYEFRRHGCHFVVCGGKSQMSRPLAISKGLGIPVLTIFDGDGDLTQDEKKQRRDNGCILKLCGYGSVDTFPTETFWGESVVMWMTKIETEISGEVGAAIWREVRETSRNQIGLSAHVNPKSSVWITHTLELLEKQGIRSRLLDKVCDTILNYAASL